MRYKLANTLNDLCVAYDHRKANRHALAAIERAATIRVEDEELLRLIPSNLRIIRNKAGRGWYNIDPNTGKKRPKIRLIIALFIIIISIVTASGGCNSDTAHFNIYNLPNTAIQEIPTHELSFRSLLKTLINPMPVMPVDSFFKPQTYMLIRPTKAGDNPFRNLFTDTAESKLYTGSRLGDTNQLIIANESSWEAIMIYQQSLLMYGSVYVPPHITSAIQYYTHNIALQLYAGRDWSDSILHAYDHYVTRYLLQRRYSKAAIELRPVFLTRIQPGRQCLIAILRWAIPSATRLC